MCLYWMKLTILNSIRPLLIVSDEKLALCINATVVCGCARCSLCDFTDCQTMRFRMCSEPQTKFVGKLSAYTATASTEAWIHACASSRFRYRHASTSSLMWASRRHTSTISSVITGICFTPERSQRHSLGSLAPLLQLPISTSALNSERESFNLNVEYAFITLH